MIRMARSNPYPNEWLLGRPGETGRENADVFVRHVRRLGIETLTGAKAKSWAERGDRATITVETAGGEVQLDADKVLVAVS